MPIKIIAWQKETTTRIEQAETAGIANEIS
jgi:hypothetical protein